MLTSELVLQRISYSGTTWFRSRAGGKIQHVSGRRRDHAIHRRFSLEARSIIESVLSVTFVMLRFRKSKAPVPSTPTHLAELIHGLGSRRKPGALVVSSAAIALSISSAFSDNRDASSDGRVIARGTAWGAAHSATKMALDVVKESSDSFIPLKAVTGALSVLMKSYNSVSVSCL